MNPLDNPAFRSWFNNSVVYDHASQRPKVAYHGTIHWKRKEGGRLGDFTAFDRNMSAGQRGHRSMDNVGMWFSGGPDEKGAGMYAGTTDSFHTQDDGPGGSIIPVYLSLQNPAKLTWAQFMKMGQDAAGWEPTTKSRIPDKDWQTGEWRTTPSGRKKYRTHISNNPTGRWDPDKLREKLKSEGYDGIWFPASEKIDGSAHPVYVVFEPNQIKSATGNRGTFSLDSDHIGEAEISERADLLLSHLLA